MPARLASPVPIKSNDAGSGTGVVDATKSPDCELLMDRPEAKSAGVQVPLGQKKSCICSGVIPAMLELKLPSHALTPAPSVAVPNTGRTIVVEVPMLTRINGEPAKSEHDCPMARPEQFVLAEPGPTAVAVYSRVAWVTPFPANCRKGLLGPNPTPRFIGTPFATKTPSVGENGAASRHPGVPSTPLGQPAKVKFVEFATSLFHGGPGGVADGSGLKVMLVSVNVTVPPEPVFRLPTMVADAEVARSNRIAPILAAKSLR